MSLVLRNKFQHYPLLVFKGSLIILIAAIPFSRALISISTGLLFVAAIAEFFINHPKPEFKNKYFICLTAIVLFCLLDGLRAFSAEEWVRSIEIKLPLVIYPFAILIFKNKIGEAFLRNVSILFCSSISLSVVASIYNYFLNYEEINQLVLQSKNVPIMGGMHHITYSVFCAFATIVSASLAYRAKLKWLWVLSVINFIGLHILTARTGLVGLYFTFIVLGLVYIIKNKPAKKYLLPAIVVIFLLPIGAFYGISSFHNRALNTWEDIKVVWNQKDANYQSMGMRVEAAKTAFEIIKKNPIIGIGNSNIKKAMGIQYEVNDTNLFLENRILPHNQFIMEMTVHGLLGLLLLLGIFLFPLFHPITKLPVLFIALWSLTLFACMFECLFDRQHGIILVSLFWFLFSDDFLKTREDHKTSKVSMLKSERL